MRRALGYDLLIGLILHLVQLSTLHAQSIPLSLEPLVESNASAQTSPVPDEDPFEEASRFLRDPLLLNEASKEELQQLPFLSGALVDLLLLHREALGPLLHLNELQGIPGFTPELIRQLAPYVRVLPPDSFSRVHPLSFLGLTQDFLCRVTGMLTGTSEQTAAAWAGNRQRWLLWHRIHSKNLQAGWLLEKDPGEAILKNGSAPFDHGGFHVFWRGNGLLKTVALGDFTVNLGQGLLHWQAMAFGKSSEASWIKRQGPVLRPHRSSGEINFHSGMAATIGWKPLSFTFFVSRRSLSGRVQYDTSGIPLGVGSISTSGYHRTATEIQGRNALRQYTAGARLSMRYRSLELSINAVKYFFSLPYLRSGEPRNVADLQGRSWYNGSIDFSYTRKNVHCFGEGALAANGSGAFLLALIATPAAGVDLFALVRKNGVAYRALYANAFAESSTVENEQGFYLGITLRPKPTIRIDAYADHYVFPWIRYRAHASTAGVDYLVQLEYRPHKRTSLQIRYRVENKWEATLPNPDSSQVAAFDGNTRRGWRSQLSVQFSSRCRVRTRVEWLAIDPNPRPALYE
ncbi:MAG: helix-hairpin-helix domain-containing protein, partial [Sphingomonadales bacterium]